MNIPKQLHNSLAAEIDPAFSQRAELIFKEIATAKPKTVLDMGCGRGFYSHGLSFFPSISKIHGVDVNRDYLDIARKHCTDKRIKLHQASIYSLPFPDGYFDCIVFSEVLEHIGNEKKALAELFRVLKKNGRLIVTVPCREFPLLWDPLNWLLMRFFHTHVNRNVWWLAGIWADHTRLYTEEQFMNTLKKNGFALTLEPVKILHWSWPFAHFLLYGIGKNIVERLHVDELSRFSFGKPKPLARLLSLCMSLPSRLLDDRLPTKASVNLFAVAVK